MSKFGETADRILEILHNGEKLDLEEIEKILSLSDAAIIYFMNEFGLIELNEGKVKITESGLDLLA
jgi:hypothetical protein